jgi:ubiquinone/menaquinone biosynthesis C-methylase UbiE
MNIPEIVARSRKPVIYEKGDAFMWTDPYISTQILDIHLNPDVDLGSRKISSIQKTTGWILDCLKGKSNLKILDLGCGPGLYTEIFAEKGHQVTGVDISETSIEYAIGSAENKNLNIDYIHANYLDLDFEKEAYDLVIMIYTDLGVLFPDDRDILLSKIYKTLKKDGLFIFDVLRDNDLEQKTTPRTWEAAESGFWKDSPYLALSESWLYQEEKVILFQHLIIDSENSIKTYRFWTHFFDQKTVKQMLQKHGFNNIRHRDDILPEGDLWSGDNVIFTIASK